MKLHNFIIKNGMGILKRARSGDEWNEAYEKLDKWLRWYRDGEDPYSWIPEESESMSESARRAENNTQVRHKLVTSIRRLGLLRLNDAHSDEEAHD